jgi:hypothetical protein
MVQGARDELNGPRGMTAMHEMVAQMAAEVRVHKVPGGTHTVPDARARRSWIERHKLRTKQTPENGIRREEDTADTGERNQAGRGHRTLAAGDPHAPRHDERDLVGACVRAPH